MLYGGKKGEKKNRGGGRSLASVVKGRLKLLKPTRVQGLSKGIER